MPLARWIACQLGRPSALTARLLNVANRRDNARAIEVLAPTREHRVLDVGFGGGVSLEPLTRRAGFVAGIDRSDAAVRAVRGRLHGLIGAGRLDVREAAVDDIPFEDAAFDRVLAVHTIYFWADPARGLREIVRVLTSPGGRLVLVTDLGGPPAAIARHGFRSFPPDEQVALLRAAGFDEVRIERRGRIAFALAVT